MKKLFISIFVISITNLLGYADTTLSEAYDAISSLSGMSEKSVSKVSLSSDVAITNLKSATVNSSVSDVEKYRDNIIYTLENLPVRNMVIGANNMRNIATVYSSPSGNGNYNVLIVTGNTQSGQFSVSYGQTSKKGVDSIRNTQLTMDVFEIVLVPEEDSNLNNYVTMK